MIPSIQDCCWKAWVRGAEHHNQPIIHSSSSSLITPNKLISNQIHKIIDSYDPDLINEIIPQQKQQEDGKLDQELLDKEIVKPFLPDEKVFFFKKILCDDFDELICWLVEVENDMTLFDKNLTF